MRRPRGQGSSLDSHKLTLGSHASRSAPVVDQIGSSKAAEGGNIVPVGKHKAVEQPLCFRSHLTPGLSLPLAYSRPQGTSGPGY